MTDRPYLPRYNWEDAEAFGWATANGFKALGIHPVTIRKWASLNKIHAVGKAPGGAHLYRIEEVLRHAKRKVNR